MTEGVAGRGRAGRGRELGRGGGRPLLRDLAVTQRQLPIRVSVRPGATRCSRLTSWINAVIHVLNTLLQGCPLETCACVCGEGRRKQERGCPRSLRFQAQATGRLLCPCAVSRKSGGERGCGWTEGADVI